MVKCFHPAVGKMFYVVGTQCYMPALCFAKSSANIYIYIYIIIQIFLNFFQKTVSKRRTLSELNWSLMCPKRPQRHFGNCFVWANQPLCLAFGTGEGLLRYGICVPCSKRLPGVRDAFSEGFGAQNRLLRYGRDIRCQKQAPLVRDASSKARRTADSTECGQPPGVRNAFSEACRAKSSLLPHRTHLQCAKRPSLGSD